MVFPDTRPHAHQNPYSSLVWSRHFYAERSPRQQPAHHSDYSSVAQESNAVLTRVCRPR